MERFYLGQSTLNGYGKDSRPNVIPIVRAFADFSSPINSPFIGFIVDKLSKADTDAVYDKIGILTNQVTKQFFRIIACQDNRYNKVYLPNVKLFNDMFEKIKKGKQVDGVAMTSIELADAYVSCLEECIDRNYEAEKFIGVLPDSEPNPRLNLREGLKDTPAKPYVNNTKGGRGGY